MMSMRQARPTRPAQALALLALLAAAAEASVLTVPLKEYVTVFDGPSANGRGHRQIHVSEYYGRVAMGDPPQAFDVVFDTGSGNIVLPTVRCADEACTRHRRFTSGASKTAVQLAYEDGTPLGSGSEEDRDTTTITYGTGRLTGEYIRDTLCLGPDGGAPGSARACTMVDFLGVTQESRFPFTELPFDGIFGLGLGGLSAGPTFNFVNCLKGGNSTVGAPIFAVFLRNLLAEEDSEISFGGWRPERLAGGDQSLSWLPVPKDEADEKGYWLVTMRDVYVKGKPLGLCDDFSDHPRCQVAMDTGSSLMMGPRHQVAKLLQAIGGCSGPEPLPTLRFQLDALAGGTFEMELTPEDYAEVSEGSCATAFQAIDLPPTLGPMWVFGQTVLRKYYTVYDAKQWRVGVGLAEHTKARRELPTTLAPTTTPAPVEACIDDNRNMVWNHLPGCKSFASMGYCTRFAPLAHHYCRLSCELCVPDGHEQDLPPPPPVPGVPPEDPVHVRVKGSGLKVAGERRGVVGVTSLG